MNDLIKSILDIWLQFDYQGAIQIKPDYENNILNVYISGTDELIREIESISNKIIIQKI